MIISDILLTPYSNYTILMSLVSKMKVAVNPPVWKNFLNGFDVFECFKAIPSLFCFRRWYAS